MSEPNPNPTPAPAPEPAHKRQRSTINRGHLTEIANSRKVAAAALGPNNAAALAEVEFDATLPDKINTLADSTEQDIGKLTGARVQKVKMTVEEKAARKALIAVIAPIQTAARRKYAGNQTPMRQAYFIRDDLANDTLHEVLAAAGSILARLSPGENNAPAQDALPGIKDKQLKALSDAIALYGGNKAEQENQKKIAGGELEVVVAGIGQLAAWRRQTQLAAEQAFQWRTPGVATIRKSFLLPPNRPLPDGHQ